MHPLKSNEKCSCYHLLMKDKALLGFGYFGNCIPIMDVMVAEIGVAKVESRVRERGAFQICGVVGAVGLASPSL